MGRNSLVLVRNDAEHIIKDRPEEFVGNMFHAIEQQRPWAREPGNGDFPTGHHGNVGQAVWNEHADVTGLIAVGGNHATVLMRTHNGGRHHVEEDQLDLLRKWATSMGYDLVKHTEDP